MSGSFAFALPMMLLGFGCAFLILWRWGARGAFAWGAAFLCDAIAFSTLELTSLLPVDLLTIVGDATVLAAFLLFGQGLIERMGGGARLWPRLAIASVSLGLTLWAVLVMHSLRAELLANSLGCAALAAIPLMSLPWRGIKPVDRLLLGLIALEIADCVISASTVFATAPGGFAEFLATEYAFAMQASSLVLADLFALTGMAAMTLDLLSRYRTQASSDPLSGLLNRRGFEEAAARCQSGRVSGTVVTCDIDHFKRINDRFGHAAGDLVIRALADIMLGALPRGGIAARFGGEEFVVHLPSCGAGEAKAFAELVRSRLAEQDWSDVGLDLPLTVSFGIAGTMPTDFSLHDGIMRADGALYEAKRGGRDRIVVGLSLLAQDKPTVAVGAVR